MLVVLVALLAIALGQVRFDRFEEALLQIAPLALFLTSAVWLATVAERAGLAARLAATLSRAARGRRISLYLVTCATCALLTSAVSLDGAVVLMVPLVLALGRGSRDLVRPLLLGTVAVANAFSLAVPQGNPTNILVMERLGLSPATFVAHLLGPALVATGTCVAVLALAERRALRGAFVADVSTAPSPTGDARLAVAALVSAAFGGAASPWLGIAPWWPLSAAAAIAFAGELLLRRPRPSIRVPWQISFRVLALLLVVGSLTAHVHLGSRPATSLVGLVALSLATAAVAAVANNLPASALAAGLLGSHLLPASAALAGLTVGAVTTPHGSVATLMALDGASRAGDDHGGADYVRLWLPVGVVATVAAVATAWLVAGIR